MDCKTVRNWLKKIKDLEIEKSLLEEEWNNLNDVHDAAAVALSPKCKGTPDPDVVGGRTNDIRRPTEKAAISLAKLDSRARQREIEKEIKEIKYEMFRIKGIVKAEKRNGTISAVEYAILVKYYFLHMKIKKIASDINYQPNTVKEYKSDAIEKLALSLKESDLFA